jgi:MoaD family protein
VKIEARFFSRLKDVTGAENVPCELPDRALVSDLIEKLYENYPKLREWDGHLLTAIGVEYVKRDHPLRDGDEVSLMPPVQGG